MKVTVIGPGALGCLLAGRMARAGAETTLVDHRSARATELQKNGVTVESNGDTFTVHPKVASRVPSGQDCLFLAVKSAQVANLEIPGNVPTVTFQCGLGVVETVCSITGSANVIAGIISESALLLSPGHVKQLHSGPTSIGAWTTCPTESAASVLSRAGFAVDVTEAPGQAVWESVAIAAGIQPLTALLGVSNGKLIELPEARQLLRDLVVEAAKVASTEGYQFAYSLVEKAEEACMAAPNAISPMLQDVRAGRPTEIGAISGEILRRAQLAALPTPRTRVVWQLIRGLERR